MLVSSDIFVSLVAGLAVPLALLDAYRTVTEDRLPVQGEGPQFETRFAPWLLAIFAGPALLFDRVAGGWRDGTMSRPDIGWGAVITAGWAILYGFVLLEIVKSVSG